MRLRPASLGPSPFLCIDLWSSPFQSSRFQIPKAQHAEAQFPSSQLGSRAPPSCKACLLVELGARRLSGTAAKQSKRTWEGTAWIRSSGQPKFRHQLDTEVCDYTRPVCPAIGTSYLHGRRILASVRWYAGASRSAPLATMRNWFCNSILFRILVQPRLMHGGGCAAALWGSRRMP